jgi:hypothetical protein
VTTILCIVELDLERYTSPARRMSIRSASGWPERFASVNIQQVEYSRLDASWVPLGGDVSSILLKTLDKCASDILVSFSDSICQTVIRGICLKHLTIKSPK